MRVAGIVEDLQVGLDSRVAGLLNQYGWLPKRPCSPLHRNTPGALALLPTIYEDLQARKLVLKALSVDRTGLFAILRGTEKESVLSRETTMGAQEASGPPALMLRAWERPEKLEFMYVFNPKSWTGEAFRRVQEEVEPCQ